MSSNNAAALQSFIEIFENHIAIIMTGAFYWLWKTLK